MYNPLKLCREATELVINEDEQRADASGVTHANIPENGDRSHLSYVITLFMQKCREMYFQSVLNGVVPFESFVFSILSHEVGHIVAGSFKLDFTFQGYTDGVLQWLMNVLEDNREEYFMMRHYSHYAGYLQLSTAVIQWKLGGDELAESGIGRDTQALMFLIRFGVIIEGADPKLMNFAYPLVIASTRGDLANTIEAAHLLYAYLDYKHRTEPSFDTAKGSVPQQKPLTDDEIEEVLAGKQVVANANKGMLDDIASAASGVTPDAPIVGSGGPPLTEEVHDDAFYEAVIAGYSEVIQELRQLFIRSRVKTMRKRAKDGDIDFKRQTGVYLDGLMGTSGDNYQVFRRTYPDLQVVIMRDVSWSTNGFKEAYAMASVVTLAALDDEVGVEYAFIDFTGDSALVIDFGGSVRKDRIYPMAVGGTSLCPALDIAFGDGSEEHPGLNWKARERVLIIYTDGDIYDWDDARERIVEYQREFGLVPMLFNIAPDATDAGSASDVPWASHCRLEQLPEAVMATLTGVIYA